MRLIISTGNGEHPVAVVDDYQGPVPRAGDSIHYPQDGEPSPGVCLDGFMTVRAVMWGIVARDPCRVRGWMVGAEEPFVEVIV